MKTNGINASARLLCGAATFLALTATGAPVLAQDKVDDSAMAQTTADEGDAIIVTGIRGSIQTSLDAKRNATSIVEVIASEDIGLLPDQSIADSLARLPGVTAQRVRGRSQQVSIRGLGPDFSLALLNGREVVSAGNNRGIEFDQFPSELVASGVVYKTGDAQLAAIGIAGAVDLRTVRPLDSKKRQITASATYSINDQGKLNPDYAADGYRFFGSYIDQNADGTIGWSIGATVQSVPTQYISRELKTQDSRENGNPTVLNGQVRRDANGVFYPADNPRQGVVSREFKRTSVAGSLQFEPTDDLSITLDGFYTNTKDSGIFRGTETPIASWSGASFGSATGTRDQFATSATYTGVVPILRTDTQGADSDIYALGANVDYKVTDNLGFVVDYGYSNLDRNDINYESYAGTGRARSGAQDTLTFTFPRNGEYSIKTGLDYTNPANALLTDPGGWGQVGFIKKPVIQDELNQLRTEAYWDFDGGIIDKVTVGWLYTDRQKDFDSNEAFLRPSAAFGNGLRVPTSAIVGATNTKSLGMNILAYDPSRFLTDGTYVVEKATFDTQWSVGEKVHNAYIQADINGDLGSVPVKGNIGLRYADTKQTSTGTIAGGVNRVNYSFDNWLPSANLAFEVMPDTFIRLAASQTVTRARLDQLAANQNLSYNRTVCADTNADQIPDTVIPGAFQPPRQVCYTLSGGNPRLEPYRSTNFDISFEKYFSPGTAIIVAGFYKDLSDWVVDQTSSLNVSREVNLVGWQALLNANPALAQGTYSGPTNFASGKIKGVEGTLRLNYGDLTDALDGFGSFASVTYADAKISNGTVSTPIPGYSKTTWSADVFYEKYGFRAKLAARYRSGFLSEVQNFAGQLQGAQALSETILDGQIGYTFDKADGFLGGVQILAEVFNLTNEPFVTENNLFNAAGTAVVGTFPSRHETYGRTFNFTIRKTF